MANALKLKLNPSEQKVLLKDQSFYLMNRLKDNT